MLGWALLALETHPEAAQQQSWEPPAHTAHTGAAQSAALAASPAPFPWEGKLRAQWNSCPQLPQGCSEAQIQQVMPTRVTALL